MTRDEHGRLRLDCKLGTYYHSLSTSECLDAELSEAYAAWPDSTPDVTWPRLERPPLPFETSLPGVFAVGDVRHGSIKRVASAVGEGSIAIRLIHEYLSQR
jgi:NADPH-dependent glutamate synthase beta subunit-like oxidoreductase